VFPKKKGKEIRSLGKNSKSHPEGSLKEVGHWKQRPRAGRHDKTKKDRGLGKKKEVVQRGSKSVKRGIPRDKLKKARGKGVKGPGPPVHTIKG